MSIQEELTEAISNINDEESVALIEAILNGNPTRFIDLCNSRREEDERYGLSPDEDKKNLIENLERDPLFLKNQLIKSVAREGISPELEAEIINLPCHFTDNIASREIFILLFHNQIFPIKNILHKISNKNLELFINHCNSLLRENPAAERLAEVLNILRSIEEEEKINQAQQALQERLADHISAFRIGSVKKILTNRLKDLRSIMDRGVNPKLSAAVSALFSDMAQAVDPTNIMLFDMLYQTGIKGFCDLMENIPNANIAKIINSCSKNIGDHVDDYAQGLTNVRHALQIILARKNEKELKFLRENPLRYDSSSPSSEEEAVAAPAPVMPPRQLPAAAPSSPIFKGDSRAACFTGVGIFTNLKDKKRKAVVMPGTTNFRPETEAASSINTDAPRPAKLSRTFDSEAGESLTSYPFTKPQIPEPPKSEPFSMIFGIPFIPQRPVIAMPQASVITPAAQPLPPQDLTIPAKDIKKPSAEPSPASEEAHLVEEPGREI